MLTEVLHLLRNWFEREKIFGSFKVEGGTLVGESVPLQQGQYYRIIGSVFNDGVHKKGDQLVDEDTFDGAVWTLAIPKEVIDLAADIEEWITANQAAIMSPYQSESFGGYSYTKASVNGSNPTWQNTFASRLNLWRKI